MANPANDSVENDRQRGAFVACRNAGCKMRVAVSGWKAVDAVGDTLVTTSGHPSASEKAAGAVAVAIVAALNTVIAQRVSAGSTSFAANPPTFRRSPCSQRVLSQTSSANP